MSKKLLITLWLLIPILLFAYHYGPGQGELARESAAAKIEKARLAETAEDWVAAVTAYGEALAALPPGDTATRFQVRLAQAKARIYTGELPEAMLDMERLLTEMLKAKADTKQIREVRGHLATAQYYAAWLMRLEGATAEEWTPEAEQSRQNFRLLAEETLKTGNPSEAREHQKNLEAAIRLARMDLAELQSLPLPKQCQGCKNCSQKCRSQRESQCKNEGEKEPEDARKAGAGKRPEGTGS